MTSQLPSGRPVPTVVAVGGLCDFVSLTYFHFSFRSPPLLGEDKAPIRPLFTRHFRCWGSQITCTQTNTGCVVTRVMPRWLVGRAAAEPEVKWELQSRVSISQTLDKHGVIPVRWRSTHCCTHVHDTQSDLWRQQTQTHSQTITFHAGAMTLGHIVHGSRQPCGQ